PVVQDVAGFLDRYWPDRAHGTKLGKHLHNTCGTADDPRREGGKTIEPFSPSRLVRPRGKFVDNRQGEVPKVTQVQQVALQTQDPRRLRLIALQLGDAVPVVGGEAIETTTPACAAVLTTSTSDDGGFDDELLPPPRRSQGL